MLKESLHIYTIDADGNKVPFPSVQNPAILYKWTYTAERMAGAPSIKGTIMHKLCLDDLWEKKEFVEFNGERYYVDQEPTSSKSTDDIRYKHDITFVSKRIELENIYFFDVVTSETEEQYKDRYRSNSTKFSFYGTLHELVSRLNDSLIYSKLYDPKTKDGYHIVIDDGINEFEEKEISFENVYFATALQEIYNKFGVAYYWVGNTCHVGYTENFIITPFEYGSGKGLLSVSKNNENYRIINRVTGFGSSDNIPFYYPNEDEYGKLIFSTENIEESSVIKLLYPQIRSYNPAIYDTYTFCTRDKSELEVSKNLKYHNPLSPDQETPGEFSISLMPHSFSPSGRNNIWNYKADIDLYFIIHAKKGSYINTKSSRIVYYAGLTSSSGVHIPTLITDNVYIQEVTGNWIFYPKRDNEIDISDYIYKFNKDGYFQISMHGTLSSRLVNNNGVPVVYKITPELKFLYGFEGNRKFFLYKNNNSEISYSESGIILSDIENIPSQKYISSFKDGEWVDTLDETNSSNPAKIKITDRKWLNPTGYLMPPIYRDSNGAERFYDALNDTYDKPNGGKYTFNNPYTGRNHMEGIQNFDEIKPSIKGIKNADGKLLGEIAGIAFDSDDSDEKVVKDENSVEYIHSYFYVKLHIYNGSYGFNLFKQALESGAMTFNMTSGNCAGCSFEVCVSKPKEVEGRYEFDNPVQVYSNGNIVSGNYSDKIKFDNIQQIQQDTSKYEVWVALKKETSTYGVVMPNVTNNYKPSVGDTFVITNILMPQVYITNAENELKEALLKYMSENNDEKFSFNITFSRIYLQENPEIASMLNENARLIVSYNNHDYTLYVSSFSCKVEDDILSEISIEVSDDFTIGKSSIRDKVSECVNDIIGNNSVDILSSGQRFFLNKLQEDTAKEEITFEKGISFGEKDKTTQDDTTKYEIDGNGNAYLKKIIVSELLSLGDKYGINKDGASVLKNIILSGDESILSDNFVLGSLGKGFGLIKKDYSGHSYLEIDKLFVRMSAIFSKLEIHSLKYSGGIFVFSPAGDKIKMVEKVPAMADVTDENGTSITDEKLVGLTTDNTGNTEVFRCWLNTDDGEVRITNEFKVGDLVKSQDFNIKSGSYDGVSNVFYWRKCVFVGEDFIDLSITDCADGSNDPKAGDEIVTMGNDSDIDRQNIILISTVGENAPEFVQYENVDGYSLEDKMVTRISPKGNVFKGTFLLNTGNSVENSINDIYESVENLSTDVYSEINVLNESITQTVTKLEEYVEDSESLANRISQAELELKPENVWIGIQQSVSTRNIFQDGSFEYGLNVFEYHNKRLLETIENGALFGSNCIRIKPVEDDGVTHWVRNVPITPVKGGSTYTFVFWFMSLRVTSINIIPRFVLTDGSTVELSAKSITPYARWNKNVISFSAPSNAYKFGFVVYNIFGGNGYMLLDGMMLFEGDISEQAEKLTRFIPCDTDESEATIKTGIDIKKREINVTTDQFNIYNNAGEKTASVNEDGVLETNGGRFNDVEVSGSISQPWVVLSIPHKVNTQGNNIEEPISDDTSVVDAHNVNEKRFDNLVIKGESLNVSYTYNNYLSKFLFWEPKDSGRTVYIASFKIDTSSSSGAGSVKIKAHGDDPDINCVGGVFFEGGNKVYELNLSGEIVMLKGIGTSNVFYGWAVISRTQLFSVKI